MRFFAIGHDFHINFKNSENAETYYRIVIGGWSRKTCAIQPPGFKTMLTSVNCENLQNDFDYSEFTVVTTKGMLIISRKNTF